MPNLNHILGPQQNSDEPHPSMDELARFADGLCKGEERDRILTHIAACAGCYDVVQQTLTDLELEAEGVKAKLIDRTPVKVWAIAVSVVLCLIAGASVYRMGVLPFSNQGIEQPAYIASISLDNELRDVLSGDGELEIAGIRAEELIRLLENRGLAIGQPDVIMLANSYSLLESKGLFAPKEVLKIRLEDGVLYLEVVPEQKP